MVVNYAAHGGWIGASSRSLSESLEQKDRRRVPRINAIVRATVRVEGMSAVPFRGRALDLSCHGVRLLMRKGLVPGTPIILDLECELPVSLHLGFGDDSIAIEGPLHQSLVRLEAIVTHSVRRRDNFYEVGAQFETDIYGEELVVLDGYIEFLRRYEDYI